MHTSLSRLQSFYSEFKAPLLLHAMIRQEFAGTVALLTSFDAESGLLLSMAAEINPETPVLFLDDGSQAAYARTLTSHLGLRHVHRLTPAAAEASSWKAELSRALDAMGLLAIVTGRRRAGCPKIELDENGVFRINPLAGWTKEEQNGEMAKRILPPYPLTGPVIRAGGPDPCDLAIGAEEGPAEDAAPLQAAATWSV